MFQSASSVVSMWVHVSGVMGNKNQEGVNVVRVWERERLAGSWAFYILWSTEPRCLQSGPPGHHCSQLPPQRHRKSKHTHRHTGAVTVPISHSDTSTDYHMSCPSEDIQLSKQHALYSWFINGYPAAVEMLVGRALNQQSHPSDYKTH